jgi:hypothetical protein
VTIPFGLLNVNDVDEILRPERLAKPQADTP